MHVNEEDQHPGENTAANTNSNSLEELLLQEILEDPVKYASEHLLPFLSGRDDVSGFDVQQQQTLIDDDIDDEDAKTKSSSDDHHHHHHDNMGHNSFCNPMMSMDEHTRRLHGVGTMPLGGDMSKGMVMYMDGFRFALAGNQPCLNLYFPSWTLDTRFKFFVCLLFVFLLSFGTEGVSKARHTISSRRIPGRQSRRTRQIMLSSLHGVQALLGYTVMLATMTFSVEILMAVVAGLSSGYYYYFAGEIGLEGHVTTNPCCNYMQEESEEQNQMQQQQQQHQQLPQQQQQSIPSEDAMTAGLLTSATPRDGSNV